MKDRKKKAKEQSKALPLLRESAWTIKVPFLSSPHLLLHSPYSLLYASLAGAPFLGQIRLHRLGVFGRVARRSEACQLDCHFFLSFRLTCRKYAIERDAEPE
ncbi:hypothetical protein ACSS6W_001734 [Trichoderma asperelloides]